MPRCYVGLQCLYLLLRLGVRIIELRDLRALVISEVCHRVELLVKLFYLCCRIVLQLFQLPNALGDDGNLLVNVAALV